MFGHPNDENSLDLAVHAGSSDDDGDADTMGMDTADISP